MPDGMAHREKDRVFLDREVGASGSLIVQLTTKGMERRLGTAMKPSVALMFCHVFQNQKRRAEKMAQMQARITQLNPTAVATL